MATSHAQQACGLLCLLLVAVLGSSALVGWTCERADGGRGFAGPFSLEIEFQGLNGTDPSAAIIDRGVAQSYRLMQNLNLVGPPGAAARSTAGTDREV